MHTLHGLSFALLSKAYILTLIQVFIFVHRDIARYTETKHTCAHILVEALVSVWRCTFRNVLSKDDIHAQPL